MNLSYFIARRYLISKRKHNIVNIISWISVCGIGIAAFALLCILSVFNGFHNLIDVLFTNFDPQVKVVCTDGKFFKDDSTITARIGQLECVSGISRTIQDQALITYNSNQEIITLKGVDSQYSDQTGILSILTGPGSFMLADKVSEYIVPGIGLAHKLESGAVTDKPYTVYVPKPGGRYSATSPQNSLNSKVFYSSGVLFAVNQSPYDDNYALVSLSAAQELLGRENLISALEIKLEPGASVRKSIREISGIAGSGFKVMDRYQQQYDVFKVVKIEKLISYLFLILILVIALFNIISSIIMLMIEKKDQIQILSKIGAGKRQIANIFVYNSLTISSAGAICGIILGIAAVLLQQHFGFIKMGSQGGFIVEAYPVELHVADILIVLLSVIAVSLLSMVILKRTAYKNLI